MVEVLFGEGDAGALLSVGRKNRNWRAKDVICLNFMMDIGDIREDAGSPARREMIGSLYDQEQWGKDPEMKKALREAGDRYAEDLARLKKHLESGETIRVWYSHCPYSLCGFYWLCWWMQPNHAEIYAVKLPEYDTRGDGTVVRHVSWAEMEAEDFVRCAERQNKLSDAECRMYAFMWEDLKRDNRPLRALVNGVLVGVEEDFYDFLIWEHLSSQPVMEARLIGEILSTAPLGVGDYWYARRIEYWIGCGKIAVAADSENRYERMIYRAD